MPLGSIVLRPFGFIGPCSHLPPKWRQVKERDNLPYVNEATAHISALLPHARNVHLINLSSHCPPPARRSFVPLWPTLVERCQEPFPVSWILAAVPPTLCFMRVFNVTFWPVNTDPRFTRDGLSFFHPWATQHPFWIRPVFFLLTHPKSKQSLSHLALSPTHTRSLLLCMLDSRWQPIIGLTEQSSGRHPVTPTPPSVPPPLKDTQH